MTNDRNMITCYTGSANADATDLGAMKVWSGDIYLVHHHMILAATVETCQCVLLWVETHLVGSDYEDLQCESTICTSNGAFCVRG